MISNDNLLPKSGRFRLSGSMQFIKAGELNRDAGLEDNDRQGYN